LKSLDYNVVMTFRFNNNNNNLYRKRKRKYPTGILHGGSINYTTELAITSSTVNGF